MCVSILFEKHINVRDGSFVVVVVTLLFSRIIGTHVIDDALFHPHDRPNFFTFFFFIPFSVVLLWFSFSGCRADAINAAAVAYLLSNFRAHFCVPISFSR